MLPGAILSKDVVGGIAVLNLIHLPSNLEGMGEIESFFKPRKRLWKIILHHLQRKFLHATNYWKFLHQKEFPCWNKQLFTNLEHEEGVKRELGWLNHIKNIYKAKRIEEGKTLKIADLNSIWNVNLWNVQKVFLFVKQTIQNGIIIRKSILFLKNISSSSIHCTKTYIHVTLKFLYL